MRRVRAAGCEGGAVRASLWPIVVGAETVRLVRGLAGLQVGQSGQHGRDSGRGDVNGRAGRRVDVTAGVMRVRGLVGRQGQALVHFHNVYVLLGRWKLQK